MGKIRLFRYWYYLRQGYSVYFNFIFAGINTLVVTYYLAIERAPLLKEVFPSFGNYVLILAIIGIPILVITGFLHFKRIPAFKSEQEVNVESNPYVYKLPPGFARQVKYPLDLLMSKLMLKVLKNEKLTEDEIKEMKTLQKNMDNLIKGGYVGKIPKNLPFDSEKEN